MTERHTRDEDMEWSGFRDADGYPVRPERIITCLNALEGVSDPAGFVAEHARMEDALIAIDRYEGADDYSALVHIHSLVLRTLRSIGVQEALGAAEAG